MPAELIPRWEWRTFGERPRRRRRAAGPARAGPVEESDEIYLLSTSDDATVKVRDGLIDVKRLERVDDRRARAVAAGAEGAVPAHGRGRPRRCSAARRGAAAATRATPRRLDELVAPSGAARGRRAQAAAALHGRRLHGRVDRRRAPTAGDAHDRGRVRGPGAACSPRVRELGLGRRRNVNYARAASALAGFGPRRYAVIDVGTNSVKFHVGERRRDGEWTHGRRPRRDHAPGRGPRRGRARSARSRWSGPPRRSRTWPTRRGSDGAEAIAAVGTAGLRIASNAQRLLAARARAVRRRDRGDLGRRGGPARLPRGHGRARRLADGSRVVFDTGGGSSQFTFGDGDADRRAVQRRRRRGALHRALRARRSRLEGDA